MRKWTLVVILWDHGSSYEGTTMKLVRDVDEYVGSVKKHGQTQAIREFFQQQKVTFRTFSEAFPGHAIPLKEEKRPSWKTPLAMVTLSVDRESVLRLAAILKDRPIAVFEGHRRQGTPPAQLLRV